MKTIVRAADAGTRRAWLWRHRSEFGKPTPSERPRLFVDVSAIIQHDAQTGIQRVVRAVWSELQERSGAEFEAVPVFATKVHGYCHAPRNFLVSSASVVPGEPVSMCRGDRFIGLDLSAHLLPRYRQQLRSWRAHGGTIHIVVYDLLPLLRPDWFNAPAASHFRKWLAVLEQDADQAICISDQVARELRRRVAGTAAEKRLSIGRIPMGSDIAQSVPTLGLSGPVREVLASMRFRPTVLMVGTVEPRKGYDVALAAFDYLWRSSPAQAPDLVIIGKAGWKTKRLQKIIRSHPMLGRKLHWLEGVSDEALCHCYDAARGLLVTSRGEGFGLPLIEAAEHRLPVLARDLPVFREQKLPNVAFFVEEQPQALARQIIELSETPKANQAARLISWRGSVNALVQELGIANKTCSWPEARAREAL